MEILQNFDKWKEFLRGKVLIAEKMGFSDVTIAKGVDLVQNFLSKTVEPQNPEERLLHQLWELGDKEERKALSNLILKLVKADDYSPEKDSPEQIKH